MGTTTSIKTYFWTHEVVVLTGFSKHMLDYLVREEIFAPSLGGPGKQGHIRRYSYADVVVLRALNTICEGKGKIRHLRTALQRFRDEFGPIRAGQRIDQCLFVQGDELCAATSAEGGRQLRSGQMTLGFFVDLGAISEQIAGCVVVGPSRREFSLVVEMAAKAEAEKQRLWAETQRRRAKAKASEAAKSDENGKAKAGGVR